jgi:hypothetical protein
VSAFEEQMKEIASRLSPEAAEVVKHVITAESRRRFSGNRSQLPHEFATRALQLAKGKEASQ